MKEERTIVFDLDHTLLDTDKFKKALFLIISKYGRVPLRKVEESYRQLMYQKDPLRFDYLTYDYRLVDHLKLLSIKNKSLTEQIRTEVNRLLKQSSKFVFSNASATLSELKKQGYRLVLASRGNRAFNLKKIKYSGLKKYFSKIWVNRDSKDKFLNKLKSSKVWLVNDNLNEMLALRKKFPKVNYILVKRPGQPKKLVSNFISIRKLAELLTIV